MLLPLLLNNLLSEAGEEVVVSVSTATPSTPTSKLRLYYTAIPPLMTESTDEPEFPQEFHQGIVDLAISDLLSQARETKKALKYWESGQVYIGGLSAHVEGRQRIAKMNRL